jgi:ferric-dicitrate binding protein FerR (iron transport regulator)
LKNAPENIDDLIASYLAGEASADQISFVDEWTKENESNSKYFEHLRLIFEKAATVSSAVEQFDTDEAWQKLRHRLPQYKDKTIPLNPDRAGYTVYLRIAAGILLILAAGVFTYQFFRADSGTTVELLADKNTSADTLPDGSDVFLNRQTTIEYSIDKKKNTHTAKLVGEAYFNIHHDDDKTFIVEAEDTFIKDIGTSFNVKAYPGSPTIEVVVEEGEVMFYTEGNPGIYLKVGGKGIFHKDSKTFTVAEPEPNVTAYKTKFFSFSNHSLEMVAETLNEVYPTKIQIDPNLKNCTLTVSFNDESIEEIAEIIAQTLGLTVSKSDNIIRLTGTGCGGNQP